MVVVEEIPEDYQQFTDFDWSSDQKWQTYLDGLYPPPNQRQLLKFKKKWYKKHIDADFDDTYEPTPRKPMPSSSTSEPTSASQAGAFLPSGPHSDGARWAVLGIKSVVVALAYGLGLVMCIGSTAGVLPGYQALAILVMGFFLELVAKYGIKFSTQYLHNILLDDVGVMPMMALTLFTPGLHPVVRQLALAPPFLTGLMSFAQICQTSPKISSVLADFFSPLAESSARHAIMQWRAHLELALGFGLIAAVLMVRAAPISALLFWNFMMMRYMMSPWTQASFRKIDNVLNPTLGNIPLVQNGYAALKRGLYSFVDPQSKKAGRLCTIL